MISIKMFQISMNIHGKHLKIDRIENKIKFSLLKGCSFYFLMNCKFSEMCIRPIILRQFISDLRMYILLILKTGRINFFDSILLTPVPKIA